jgi:uncharacterized DUF497 family protein
MGSDLKLKPANKFECNKTKARSNFQKHGIRFTEGCRIFEGHSLTLPSNQNSDLREVRYNTIGVLDAETVAIVVWTIRISYIRVISVRKASRKEREKFYAYIKKSIN